MGKYDDIIGLPRPVFPVKERLSPEMRGAQFSAFAALTGFDGIIDESARLTDPRPVPDQDRLDRINSVLQFIEDNISRRPEAVIVFFVPDSCKSGGALSTAEGAVRNIDQFSRCIVLDDNSSVPIDDIYDIFAEGYTDDN